MTISLLQVYHLPLQGHVTDGKFVQGMIKTSYEREEIRLWARLETMLTTNSRLAADIVINSRVRYPGCQENLIRVSRTVGST